MGEANWIQVVNTDFLKAQVSCEIPILTCMIYLSLSIMKEKRWKASSMERGTKQTGILKEEVLKKVFLADSEVYEKMNITENNVKNRATLVKAVLSFNISPLQTTIIFIIIFYQLILADKKFKAEGICLQDLTIFAAFL